MSWFEIVGLSKGGRSMGGPLKGCVGSPGYSRNDGCRRGFKDVGVVEGFSILFLLYYVNSAHRLPTGLVWDLDGHGRFLRGSSKEPMYVSQRLSIQRESITRRSTKDGDHEQAAVGCSGREFSIWL